MACTIAHSPDLTDCRKSAQVPARLADIAREVARLARWIQRARQRQHQRRALLELDAHHLADIGIIRDDAQREAAKPFWL